MSATTVKSVNVTFKRDIQISSRHLRALIHQGWIAGNNSYELDTGPEGINERNKFIADLMVREGFAKPKDPDNVPQ